MMIRCCRVGYPLLSAAAVQRSRQSSTVIAAATRGRTMMPRTARIPPPQATFRRGGGGQRKLSSGGAVGGGTNNATTAPSSSSGGALLKSNKKPMTELEKQEEYAREVQETMKKYHEARKMKAKGLLKSKLENDTSQRWKHELVKTIVLYAFIGAGFYGAAVTAKKMHRDEEFRERWGFLFPEIIALYERNREDESNKNSVTRERMHEYRVAAEIALRKRAIAGDFDGDDKMNALADKMLKDQARREAQKKLNPYLEKYPHFDRPDWIEPDDPDDD